MNVPKSRAPVVSIRPETRCQEDIEIGPRIGRIAGRVKEKPLLRAENINQVAPVSVRCVSDRSSLYIVVVVKEHAHGRVRHVLHQLQALTRDKIVILPVQSPCPAERVSGIKAVKGDKISAPC